MVLELVVNKYKNIIFSRAWEFLPAALEELGENYDFEGNENKLKNLQGALLPSLFIQTMPSNGGPIYVLVGVGVIHFNKSCCSLRPLLPIAFRIRSNCPPLYCKEEVGQY